MPYYAPQAWTQASAVPNHQLNRNTPLRTRANTAYFGTFGYELNLNLLSEEEQEKIKKQVKFMKEYRHLIRFGTFYRLKGPFDGNITARMTVSSDRKEAVVGWYRTLNGVNMPYTRLRLQGLDLEAEYELEVSGGRRSSTSSGMQPFRIETCYLYFFKNNK